MRRGWMEWCADETPEDQLRARAATIAHKCAELGLDAVLLYSNFTRPAQVSAVTHFVPFWSQALLVITRDGATLLTMATTGRTVQWIRSAGLADDVVVGPEIGASAATWLKARACDKRIAVAALDDLPRSAWDGLCRVLPDAVIESAPWYAALESSFTPAARVAQRAREIATQALDLVRTQRFTDANALVGALDGACRAMGAEEVSVHVAPDLLHESAPFRLEGDNEPGCRFAVRITLAYKGHWIRLASSFEQADGAAKEDAAAAAILALAGRIDPRTLTAHELVAAIEGDAGVQVVDWTLESARSGLPLAVSQSPASPASTPAALPPFATFTARFRFDGGSSLVSFPLPA